MKRFPDIHTAIHDLLYSLWVTAKYIGFDYTYFAIYLAIQKPERLLLVTKWIYPDVVRRYHTNWYAVERNIRTIVAIAWELCPDKLSGIAKYNLTHRPTNTQFISYWQITFRHP